METPQPVISRNSPELRDFQCLHYPDSYYIASPYANATMPCRELVTQSPWLWDLRLCGFFRIFHLTTDLGYRSLLQSSILTFCRRGAKDVRTGSHGGVAEATGFWFGRPGESCSGFPKRLECWTRRCQRDVSGPVHGRLMLPETGVGTICKKSGNEAKKCLKTKNLTF